MALMFQRIARNYIKNGYYPTDTETTARILQGLSVGGNGEIRILDNCCGEGSALAECKHHLVNLANDNIDAVKAYGIEYNKERAYCAKDLLDVCIHADINDCAIGNNQFDLVWLNPPYGDMINDSEVLNREGGRPRLEKMFYRRTVPTLKHGGIMVLIIPDYSFDKELSGMIARHFDSIKAFKAADPTFKQTVLFGRKIKVDPLMTDEKKQVRDYLQKIGRREIEPELLPVEWLDEPYLVKANSQQKQEFKFYSARVTPEELTKEAQKLRKSSLWGRFSTLFDNSDNSDRRPLRKLSDGHLATMLAAGCISGVVKSKNGRTLIIKGDTYKAKSCKTRSIEQEDGSFSEERTEIDRFHPSIKAIDITENSPDFGRIFTIK